MKYDQNITVKDFFKDSFSVMIDLQSNKDNQTICGSGRKVANTLSGVLLELTRSATTTKDHMIYVFVISEALVNFVNNNLNSIQN